MEWAVEIAKIGGSPVMTLAFIGVGGGLIWHIKECSDRRKAIYGKLDELKGELHKVAESVARVVGMLEK